MGDEVEERFDEFARVLAEKGHTRRNVLKVGAGLVGAAVAAVLPGRAGADNPNGNDDCAHFCDSIFPPGPARGKCKSDAAHGVGLCFTCGPAAPTPHPALCINLCCAIGEICCNGKCVSPICSDGHVFNPNTCTCVCPPATPTDCNGICVNTQVDAANCGTCGHRCATGQTCVGGQCQCPTGQTVCNGACTNTNTDPNNCGTCGTVCPGGATCVNGTCVTPCPTGQIPCNGVCTDVTSDENNCGACGNVCPSNTVCVNGQCKEPGNQPCETFICSNGENFCASRPNASPSHCYCFEVATTPGKGVCLGNYFCGDPNANLCTTTADCSGGRVCVVNTCCGLGLQGQCAPPCPPIATGITLFSAVGGKTAGGN